MTLPPPSSRGHILFADDEPLIRASLSGLLRAKGFTCTCVAHGDEVLALLSQQEFDALISDLHMPGNDGLSLIKSVALHLPGLPIVLLTGNPTVETAARSVRLPVAAYLTKPMDFDELNEVLEKSIAEYRALRAMQAGRRRLNDWEAELERILVQHRVPASLPGGSMGSYLRLTLRHVILVLSDLESAIQHLEQQPGTPQALQNLDRDAALRRAVEVLRRTKQSFKSRELAELRKELEQLLNRDSAGEPEGAPVAPSAS
jgi:CheY-like chemotaxis protein